MAGIKDNAGRCCICGNMTKHTLFHGDIEQYVCDPYDEQDHLPAEAKCKAQVTNYVCEYGNPDFVKHLPFANAGVSGANGGQAE